MKKLSILLLMFVLLFTSTVAAHAGSEINVQEAFVTSEFNVIVLERTAQYEKLKLINKVTGEEQFVETFLDNDTRVVITSPEKNDILVITAKDKQIQMIENDVLIYQEEINIINEDIIPLNWTDWMGWTYWESSLKTEVGTALALAGIVASLLQVPLGLVLGLCDLAFILGVTETYWIKGRNQRYNFSAGIIENHQKVWSYSESVRTAEYLIGIRERFFDTLIE